MLLRFLFVIPSVAPHVCWCYSAGIPSGEEDVPIYELVSRITREADVHLSGWMSFMTGTPRFSVCGILIEEPHSRNSRGNAGSDCWCAPSLYATALTDVLHPVRLGDLASKTRIHVMLRPDIRAARHAP